MEANDQMNVFSVLPNNFFSPLSSKNKELYVDALMVLDRLLQYELNIHTDDYLSELVNLLENRSYTPEDDDGVSDEGSLTQMAKARLILHRFEMTGWVDREYLDGSFIEIVTPRSYAIETMKLLRDLSEENTQEYNSLVFSTYSALRQAQADEGENMYEAVVTARRNTQQLTYELKMLYHGIRGYLRKIQGQQDVNILLRDHFDAYKALADRIYYPIKTMDSVYRYMTPIQDILKKVTDDEKQLDAMAKRAMAVRRYENEIDASSSIMDDINYVLDAYSSIGGIVTEIDRKHSTYTKLSVDAIRYNMAADRTISGKLAALLKACAGAENAKRDELLEILQRGVNVNRQEFLDGSSLWHRNVKSRRISAEPLSVESGEQLSDEESARLLSQIRGSYSLPKIRGYMNRLFGEKDVVSTDEIELQNDEEFILLLLAAIRAGESDVNFKAEVRKGTRKTNGYEIPALEFERKGGAHHVAR